MREMVVTATLVVKVHEQSISQELEDAESKVQQVLSRGFSGDEDVPFWKVSAATGTRYGEAVTIEG